MGAYTTSTRTSSSSKLHKRSKTETAAAPAAQPSLGHGRLLTGTPAPFGDDSGDDLEDDFGADTLADIAEHKAEQDAIRENGGKKPRKSKKGKENEEESRAEKTTKRTRKLIKNGQQREHKTAKWARRERRVNPLIDLLNIHLTIIPSDSDSSEGSVIDSSDAGLLSDASRQMWELARRRRRKPQKRENDRLSGSAKRKRWESGKGSDDSSEDDALGGSVRDATSPLASTSNQVEPAKSRRPTPVLDISVQDRKPDVSRMAVDQSLDEEESEESDDISPLTDMAGYKAQLHRRKQREEGKKGGRPLQPSISQDVEVKKEEDPSDTDDEEALDIPMNDPRYFARLASSQLTTSQRPPTVKEQPALIVLPKAKAEPVEPVLTSTIAAAVSRPPADSFRPYQQRKAKPYFDIKSQAQAGIGPLILGKDDGGKDVAVPASINRFLRAYQREGVQFFYQHYAHEEGGLLGDDMGLGKTIQVISFLCAIMHHNCTETEAERRFNLLQKQDMVRPDSPTDFGPTALIIAPASVVDNWAREFETWSYLSVDVYRSGGDKAKRVLRDFRNGRLDVVITGFDTARNHIDRLSHLDFSCVIIDEVHRVKNPRSKTTEAYQTFLCKRRFGLTGTAMQNRYAELHTVLDWCFPDRLGNHSQWKDYVETPLKDAQKKDASRETLAEGRTRALALVTFLLPRFFLRRTKDLIADQLPKKIDNIVFCPLSDDQKQAYKRLLTHPELEIIMQHDEPCPCGKTDSEGLPYARGKCCNPDWAKYVLRWITILSKVANHAVLLLPRKEDRFHDPERYEADMLLTNWAFPPHHGGAVANMTASGLTDMDARLCGKWKILSKMLEVWRTQGDKVLIFSRSTRLLNALEWWIDSVGFNMVRLDGSVPPEKRLALCDSFNDPNGGQFIFLISTFAGGVGLNLTSANRVVIFDPNWNPVADLQAMDRSYRWGQTRDVYVYRLIGAGTIEELIYTRQIYKQHQAGIAYDAANPSRMFAGVQDDSRHHGELFGVKNLFRFDEHASRAKQSIEDAQIAEFGYALSTYATNLNSKRRGKSEESDDEGDAIAQDEDDLADTKAALNALLNTTEPEEAGNDDEITRILRDNGISHTHEHTAVVQHSKTEARISRAAIKGTHGEAATAKRPAPTSVTSSTKKHKLATSWAPSKGQKAPQPDPQPEPLEPDLGVFQGLFTDRVVNRDKLDDLAAVMNYRSSAQLAQAFSKASGEEQRQMMSRIEKFL